ncbi:MAG: hypothetical protein QXO98_05850 [Sulfolobales archaeon]
MVTPIGRGLSSVVGLVLLLLALIIISSTIYGIIRLIDDYSLMSLKMVDKRVARNSLTYMTDCTYRYVGNSALITLVSDLSEPLQIVGYVVFYGNLSYEVFKLKELYVVPPFSHLRLNLSLVKEPSGIFIVVLIRDEVTHLVVRRE